VDFTPTDQIEGFSLKASCTGCDNDGQQISMTLKLKGLLTFVAALLSGTLYAGLIGLITYPLRASLISWPIWVGLFWIVLWRFKLVRYAGYFAVLPLSILTFEFVRTISHPPIYAFQYMSLDRSHYTPAIHVKNGGNSLSQNGDGKERNVTTIQLGEDGFRADPETGKGNPMRCREVLIGDSMIYGSGLPYSDTLRPVLAEMGVDACVFGVTGNSPIPFFQRDNWSNKLL